MTYQDLILLASLDCNIIFHTSSIQPHHSVERISTILHNLSCELVLDHFCCGAWSLLEFSYFRNFTILAMDMESLAIEQTGIYKSETIDKQVGILYS